MRPSSLLQLPLLGLSCASAHDSPHRRSSSFPCNYSTLNTTVGSYTVKENETISQISTDVDRGICDIARANRMADAMLPFYEGQKLIIPAEVCKPDNSTCLIVQSDNASYANCVIGGPHTYYTLKGDTLRYIALKLNITVDTLSATAQSDSNDPDAAVQVNNFLKLPLCSPSQCSVIPKTFTYGTYKDIAEQMGTTPGQLMALNPTYNSSSVAWGEGAVISVLSDCETIGSNVTVVS
ncbi:glutathione S-transferase N-terminal domain family protein [Penicillium longicatenatum]|uniref:glutathione S-transferase N-terminal domain family protein n=1 Tax=Penicillium longicatenatum TaxID=1561947 RepID=UPI002548BF03|nr:glutathione S-transferase N-terminal domain family protein [Penicillium longicatenatum]KAJ5644154.1 glutathione S-transferase N-terminal domain family protein [Penicillium longicatenatum]